MRRFAQAFLPEAMPPRLPAGLATALLESPERYNVAVRKPATIILERGGEPVVEDFDWGLVPSWSKLPETRYTTVTARVERAPASRIYRSAWEKRRCVVPMTGYYKWSRATKPAWPYFIQSRDGQVLFAAALWDRWPADAPEHYTFAILTTANGAIPPPLVPDGPVFLPADRLQEWIAGPSSPQRFLLGMRQPPLDAYRVSRRIRKPDVDDYLLLEPAQEDPDAAAEDDTSLDDDD